MIAALALAVVVHAPGDPHVEDDAGRLAAREERRGLPAPANAEEIGRALRVVRKRFPALASIHAASDHVIGDGDDISLVRRGSTWNFVFKRGWGDCPSGCMHAEYRYVSYDSRHGSVRDHGKRSGYPLTTPLWGVPPRFPATAFATFAALTKAAHDRRWWVALHAVNVLADVVSDPVYGDYGEDDDRPKRFEALAADVVKHRKGALALLVEALDHPDPDVAGAAHAGLARIRGEDPGVDDAGKADWRAWLARQ